MRILKKAFSILLRISISIALLVFLFKQVDEKILLATIKNSDKSLLCIAFLIFSLSYMLCFLRWAMLLRSAKIDLPFKRVIISSAGGIFFSLFLPSTIGGDLVRSIDLSLHTNRPREVVATVLLDRLSGYVGLVVVALLSVAVGLNFVEDTVILVPVAIITALLGVILLVLFNKRIYTLINKIPVPSSSGEGTRRTSALARLGKSLRNLHHEIHVFRHRKKIILYNLGISVIVQLVSPITFYVIAVALGININIIYFFVFLPIIGAITLLPISIGGLGLRDATTIFFFAKAGVGKDLSFAMSLLSFLFILVYGILGGMIYVFTVRHRRLQYHKPPIVHPTPQ